MKMLPQCSQLFQLLFMQIPVFVFNSFLQGPAIGKLGNVALGYVVAIHLYLKGCNLYIDPLMTTRGWGEINNARALILLCMLDS